MAGAGRMRRALGVGVLVGLITPLAGCLGEVSGTNRPSKGLGFLTRKPDDAAAKAAATSKSKSQVLKRASLASGRVVVVAPEGYCVDGRALKSRPTGGFALLASCEILTGGQAGSSVDPAVITIQVQPRGLRREAPDAAAMAGVLAPATVLSREDGDGLALVHVASGGDRGMASVDPKYWRGTMMINGHLVGLAVYSPKGGEIAGQGGRKLILAVAENLREASPVKDYTPVPKATNTGEKPADSQRSAVKQAGVNGGFRKLFPKLLQ